MLSSPLFRISGILILTMFFCCSKYNRPVYRFFPPVARQFFVCRKCNSYDGGNYGKGPVRHYRSKEAEKCVHVWEEISEKDFDDGVLKYFD